MPNNNFHFTRLNWPTMLLWGTVGEGALARQDASGFVIDHEIPCGATA
jgi:hypothetical protein